jgi:hypothetical protein
MLRALFLVSILVGALAGTAMARAPDAGCTLPSEGFPCLHACPSWYRQGSRQ